MALKILQHGAEAIILKRGNEVIKKRIKKSYRLVELDEKIRKQRTKSEAKLLNKASEIINSPKPLPKKEKFEIYMPFIKGKKLSEHLDKFSLKKQKQICTRVGENIAKLHDKDIIHGDLTTSNMILVEDEKDNFRIFFIDFGLGFISRKIEDRAVDLHLLRQALEAKHFRHWKDLFHSVIRGYQNSRFQEAKKVFERLKAVEKRGRYKH
ncbi:Kae1-associated kinase Bud32 [Candidatus Pacearchaeota archaeon]|nr:MAG: Kae1-associated kinase Bud32 [Candidatus Pacearchaeota archaeon]